MKSVSLVVTLLSVFWSALAVDVTGSIHWNEHCQDVFELGRAKVALDNSAHSGSVTQDGRFTLSDVEPGTYILSVLSPRHQFDKLRIDVSQSSDVPEVRPYVAGTPLNPPSSIQLPYPIKLTPRHRNNFFIPPQSFNIVGMFQNPMMLMMVFGGGMMLAMPYLMKNMDPELVQEVSQNHAKMAKVQSSLQSGNLMDGFNALVNPDDVKEADGSKQGKASTTATPSKKAKKRR